MDVENEIQTYVLQTMDDENETNDGIVIENNTIIVCSENGEQVHYVPFSIQDGQVILKRIEGEDLCKRLEIVEESQIHKIKIETSNISEDDSIKESEPSPKVEIKMKETVCYKESEIVTNDFHKDVGERNSSKMETKRIMSYETEFKPCTLPPNRGGMKGLIRYGRKHLIIDQQIMISPREFKSQLTKTEDLIMKSELAPSTKQQMRHMLTGITRLFAYPAHKMPNNKLLQLYISNCTSQEQANEHTFDDMELLPIGYQIEVDPSKIKRITRKRRYPEAEEYNRKHSAADNLQVLLETANNDHGYTNKVRADEVQNKIVMKESNSETVIVQRLDENGIQNSIEVLLAAAAETSDEDDSNLQSVVPVPDSLGADSMQNGIFIIKQENDEEILGIPSEFIIT